MRQGTRANALRHARLCYDHLAGALGAAIGRGGLAGTFGLSLDDACPAAS